MQPEHDQTPRTETEAEDAEPTEEMAHADAEVEMEEAPAEVGEEEEQAVKEHEVDGDERRRRGAGAGAARGLVMVKRELLARCMTCPLCNRLLRDATTVSECLHTFCRECIYQKFTTEEVEFCPVCKIDLGCTPVEKLRADHSLQDVRSKIFPLKRKNIKSGEAAPPISFPNKRKERSISSLVVHKPRLTETGFTGRRTRVVTRKAAATLRGLGLTVAVKRENDIGDKHVHGSTLSANLVKVPEAKRQISSNAEASNRSSSKHKGDSKDMSDNAELWRPLNCLVDAANRTKSFRSSSQNPVVKAEQLNDSPSSTFANKTNPREYMQRCKLEDDKKDVPVPQKKKAVGTTRRKREVRSPANGKHDAAVMQNEKTFSSIWFSLVASFEQNGDPPLPQIPSHYLRIKDGNIPASSIQKYLIQKLNLPSESEVEIKCCGEPVSPTQPLSSLVELWLKSRPTQTTQTMVGSSAEEFVMVVTYGRPKAVASRSRKAPVN